MTFLLDHPTLFSLASLFTMWFMALFGFWMKRHWPEAKEEDREDSMVVLSATLTLLGLIIGFSFAMATTRYDQRKLYEEEEANAIGTEYLRADLLPAPDTPVLKTLLRQYLDRRIEYYESNDGPPLLTLGQATSHLQDQLWGEVRNAAKVQTTSLTALTVSGMNDVLNTQGYSQFAWWNRIPHSAWILMMLIALFANALIGFTKKPSQAGKSLLLVLPILVSVSFFLIADIDSPRGGLIHIEPVDLVSLSHTLRP